MVLSPLVRMGLLRILHFFLTLLALTSPFAAAGAKATSVLDSPRGMTPDGQPLHDDVLLLPLNAQLARNQVDGLLVPSKHWSRQQEHLQYPNFNFPVLPLLKTKPQRLFGDTGIHKYLSVDSMSIKTCQATELA
ncbi:hypothetical protein BDM02DRAFT_3118899 [Thelephora ganbajun]|uniref:Uncharacterized protein n=1 Tax=Thelephora ganbajun TaxID=370292 RepID=A0ACB6Z9W9_THEGA|nr:hypothetical protein BDM02DRAFT_3118899 [Thelephora ganbajun]